MAKNRPEDPEAALKAERRKARELRTHLKTLTDVVARAIAAIDAEMVRPSSPERGRHIRLIRDVMERENDSARHFGLGESFPLKRYKGSPDFEAMERRQREIDEVIERAEAIRAAR